MVSTTAKCADLEDEGPDVVMDDLINSIRKLEFNMEDGAKQEYYKGMLEIIDVLMGLEINKAPENDSVQPQSKALTDERPEPSIPINPMMSDELSRQPDRESGALTEQLEPSTSKKCKLEQQQDPVAAPVRHWPRPQSYASSGEEVEAQKAKESGGVNRKRKCQAETADQTEKRKLIQLAQQKLLLIVHAQNCQRQANGDQCKLRPCIMMKEVLYHMARCQDGNSCIKPYCSWTRQMIRHYERCTRNDCPVCPPIKQMIVKKRLSTNASHSINSAATPSTSALVKRTIKVVHKPSIAFRQGSKEWHRSVPLDFRKYIVNKLAQAMLDTTHIQGMSIEDYDTNARRVEAEIYEAADSTIQYHYRLANKIVELYEGPNI